MNQKTAKMLKRADGQRTPGERRTRAAWWRRLSEADRHTYRLIHTRPGHAGGLKRDRRSGPRSRSGR